VAIHFSFDDARKRENRLKTEECGMVHLNMNEFECSPLRDSFLSFAAGTV
jgi:hypothetical protein